MTNTTTKQAHNIVVRDFGSDGTGISVVVHRLGCGCRSLSADNVVSIGRVEAHEDVNVRAGVVAQRHGLDWFDFSTCDCALFGS